MKESLTVDRLYHLQLRADAQNTSSRVFVRKRSGLCYNHIGDILSQSAGQLGVRNRLVVTQIHLSMAFF